jgi:glycosyltransferase involved in cell wall biosynthesis
VRLLAFCDYYSPSSCGGAERVAREIYTRLAQDHGVDVTVIGTGGEATSVREQVGEHGIREILVPGTDLSRKLGVQLTVARSLRHVVASLERSVRPTILHANSLHFHSTIVAAGLARRSGVPLVTTAHLGSPEALPAKIRFGALAWDATLGRFVVRRSARIIAVSEAVAQHTRRLGARPANVAVAYNGVDTTRFNAQGRTPRRGPLRVGFVGRLIANKGPHLLLGAVARACASGAAIDAVITGDGPMRAALEERAAQPDLAGRVRFTGAVNDVPSALRDLDVLVRPSYTEGLPLGVLEAMACGAVVVCSDLPGNLELITDSESGLVFPAGNVDRLASALVRLAGDGQLLAGLADKAISRADDFSWDVAARVHFDALVAASCAERAV